MRERPVTCGSCRYFMPDQNNPADTGDCPDQYWKGTRSTRWPEDTRSPLPHPGAERYCKRWEGK